MLKDEYIFNKLEYLLGYCFFEKNLLLQSMTHCSYSIVNNERLEFIGDALINFTIADFIVRKFSKFDEGILSKIRSNLVQQSTLVDIAYKLQLPKFIRLGFGEIKSGGKKKHSILSDSVEALFGAVFLDGGYDVAKQLILKHYYAKFNNLNNLEINDPKTALQEYLQENKIKLPIYKVLSDDIDHRNEKKFLVECHIPSLNIKRIGSGHNKKSAEKMAAKLILDSLLYEKEKSKGTL